jgi:hypothetical protein
MRKWIVIGVAALIVTAVIVWLESWLDLHHGFVTGVATAVIALFTLTLWWNSDNQLQHTREIERAYVTGGGNYAKNRLTGAIVVRNGKQVFEVHVGNYGKTPLFLSHYDVRSAKLSDLKSEAKVLCRPVDKVHPFSDRLAPGGHTKAIGEYEIPIGDDVVYGAFWYQDIWREKEHRFRFILALGPNDTHSTVSGVHKEYFDWD